MRNQRLSGQFIKALGIFGSLEALKILCSVVRTKLVALWIGTAGVGVISLYNSTLEMLKCMTLLNLRQSSVPAIAGEKEEEKRKHICRYVDMLGLLIGIGATILVIILSPLLSYLTFESYDYAWGFAILAPTMLATSIGDARTAILQGLGQLRAIARASLYAVVASTAVAIPLFYWFRMAAIVPVLVIFPVFTTLFIFMMAEGKIKYPPHDARLFKSTVRSLIKLGSYLAIGITLGFTADYILRVYLNWDAGVDTVGLFQSGYTIVKSYVGIFFTAITMEFFPRLSATINRRRYSSVIVSHEISMSLWILMPIIVIFISFGDLIVNILYSKAFIEIVPYIIIAVTGTVLKAVSWCLSYVIVAKGDGKVYIFTEFISAAGLLAFSIPGWCFGGFAGLGWAYVCEFVLFTAATWAICRFKYRIIISARVWRVIFFALLMCFSALFLRIYVAWWAALLPLVPIGVAAFMRRS